MTDTLLLLTFTLLSNSLAIFGINIATEFDWKDSWLWFRLSNGNCSGSAGIYFNGKKNRDVLGDGNHQITIPHGTEIAIRGNEGYEGVVSNIQIVEYVDDNSKMIAWKLRYYSLKWLGEFWSKPLFTCVPCMASVHSTYFYLFFLSFVHFETKWILFYPMYVCVLCGLNWALSKTIFK